MIFCSLIQAPWIPSSVFEARATPEWIASSKLLGDVAVISTTFAIDTPATFPDAADITAPFSKKVHRKEFLNMQNKLTSMPAGTAIPARTACDSLDPLIMRPPAFGPNDSER
jgi:hypothetical protein